MKCLECGAECPDTANFCQKCGTALTVSSTTGIEQPDAIAKKKTRKKIITGIICAVLAIAVIAGGVEIYIQFAYGNRETRESMKKLGEGIEEFQSKVDETELNDSESNEAREVKLYDLYDEVSYDELITSDDYALVKINGTISQVISTSGSIYEFSIRTEDNKIIFIDYIDTHKTIDITIGKEVTIYGSYSGFEDHDTTQGNSISLPGIFAEYVE